MVSGGGNGWVLVMDGATGDTLYGVGASRVGAVQDLKVCFFVPAMPVQLLDIFQHIEFANGYRRMQVLPDKLVTIGQDGCGLVFDFLD